MNSNPHVVFIFSLAIFWETSTCSISFAAIEREIKSNEAEELFELSLEELTHVKFRVPAAITKLASTEIPASITTISAKDIYYTPARNIYDLIEIYVPGAYWMNHEEGPHPAIRGSIVNRNYKYLLLVNGRVMNSQQFYGAKSELEQWDLSDIDRIEVVRGPGSVTYGAGAVAGVINIITKTPETTEGGSVAFRYVNKYESKGATASYTHKSERYQVYSFLSATRTKGYAARQFLVTDDNQAGYVGEDILTNSEVLDYYADYQDNPQVKAYIDVSFADNWRLWFRYTQQGSTWRGNEVKSDFNGQLLNQQSIRDRQWTMTLEHRTQIRSDLEIFSMISIDSFDAERRGEQVRNPDPDHAQNFNNDYSENELFLKSQLNWQATLDTEVAFGAEFSRDKFGAGWGDNTQNMRLGEDGDIVSDQNSNAIGSGLDVDEAVFVGEGWYTSTFSVFTEANTALTDQSRLLLSARADKNTYTDWLISPRFALITNFKNKHIFKAIVQQSRRMNTAGQLYIENLNGLKRDEETLSSLELAYSGQLNKQNTVKFSSFYNDAEVIAWEGDINASLPVGDLQLFGIETEYQYSFNKGIIGANYSYVKQLDWNLSDNLTSSGISYSDYNQPLQDTNAVMPGVGNDINNWPNHALKFFSRFNFSPKLTLHVDAHVLWQFQGAKDGLESLRRAVAGEPEEAAVNQSLSTVADVDAYEYDFRMNASLTYKHRESLHFQLLIQNLTNSGNNKRYSYDSGNDRASPRRVRFVEEPRTLGFRITYQY